MTNKNKKAENKKNVALQTKDFFERLNKSESFKIAEADILYLMERCCYKTHFLESKGENTDCNFEMGMIIVKAFDEFGFIPKMKWLPEEVRELLKKR